MGFQGGKDEQNAALKAFDDVGYKGYLAPNHRLQIVGDSEWGHRYWAYALGYIKALLMTLRSQEG